jgi:aspartyl-tRNA(Asn)/glutamyl-tRNA(Gln) amidotransferase subunit C
MASGGRVIDRDEVLRIARLAALDLDDDAVDRLAGELSSILEYVARLESLDLDGVPPHAAGEGGTPLRPDALAASLDADTALAPSPAQGEGYFKVPRVID